MHVSFTQEYGENVHETIFSLKTLSKVETFEKMQQTKRSVNAENVFYQVWSMRKVHVVWTQNLRLLGDFVFICPV